MKTNALNHKSLMFGIFVIIQMIAVTSQGEPPSTESASINALPVLLKELDNPDEKKKNIAIDGLQKLEPQSESDVQLLMLTATKAQGETRKAALHALDSASDKQIHLKKNYLLLLNTNDKELQRVGMNVLAKMHAREAAPKILDLMKKVPKRRLEKFIWMDEMKTSTPFLYSTAEALVKLDYVEAADEILSRDEIMANSNYGGSLVAKFGAKVMPKLLENYGKGGKSRDGALAAITHMKDEAAIPQLLPLTQNKDEELRKSALSALIFMPNIPEAYKDGIIRTLTPMMKDSNSSIRSRAYTGLIQLDNKKYLLPAMQALKKDSDVRLDILYALYRNPNPDAVPYLEEFIKYDETQRPNASYLRSTAAQAIFKAIGKRVPYRGLEKDQKKYKDPYIGQ